MRNKAASTRPRTHTDTGGGGGGGHHTDPLVRAPLIERLEELAELFQCRTYSTGGLQGQSQGGLHAMTQSKGVKYNPDIVYAVSDVKATYCRVQCLTLNLLPGPLKCVHISAS